mmetsp:Transcript_40735/g.97134  ORF Transcript_40735/g.97134 Transcript_40735/m.97134 type:complete len:229 (-) Transcript_40735:41-727(-)
MGDSPRVIDQVGAEDGGPRKGHQQAHEPRVQGGEDHAEQAEAKQTEGQGPQSSPQKGEVALGAEGVDGKPCGDQCRNHRRLGHQCSHAIGSAHCRDGTHIEGHDSCESAKPNKIHGIAVLSGVADQQGQASGDEGAPAEDIGPVHHEADHRMSQRSAAQRRKHGRSHHLGANDAIDLPDKAQTNLLCADALKALKAALKVKARRVAAESCARRGAGHDDVWAGGLGNE